MRRNWLKRAVQKFLKNDHGNIAVFAALSGLPILLCAGYALDQNRAVKNRSHIAAALDSAALAAVMPNNLNDVERAAFAQTTFDKNYTGIVPVKLEIDATREQVDITGYAQVPSLVGGIIGKDMIGVQAESTAVVTRSDVVCVLALDPTGARAIEFKDQAMFNSPACSVQANSTHSEAMVSSVVQPPVAKSFCVSGVSRGEFYPVIKHGCTPVVDPYKNLQVPAPASKCDSRRQVAIRGNNSSAASISVLESQLSTTATGETIIPPGSRLSPGVYCKGLNINGADVTLMPGVYHIWGNLEIGSFAAVYGDRVTIILKGTNNRLIIRDGAQVSLRAPDTGLTAGLVFWQVHLDFFKYVYGRKTKAPTGVTATSEISSGGGLKIIGTAYFPNHKLVISSDSPVATQSPATSFIAYQLEFSGKSNTQVYVNHQAGGIPPLLPRSDDGARLIQ